MKQYSTRLYACQPGFSVHNLWDDTIKGLGLVIFVNVLNVYTTIDVIHIRSILK